MNNTYPKRDPNGIYHVPNPPPVSTPYGFDPNTGFYGDINFDAQNASLGSYYNSPNAATMNNVSVPHYPTTPIVNAVQPTSLGTAGAGYGVGGAMQNNGIMNKVNGWMGKSTDNFQGVWDGTKSAFGTAGANASTAWGKMSYGERGTAMLGAATGLYGAYNAHKTNKLAKEQLNFTKDSFNRNFEAQAKTTNAQLADRQNARHTRNPNAHASVSDYMKKYGV